MATGWTHEYILGLPAEHLTLWREYFTSEGFLSDRIDIGFARVCVEVARPNTRGHRPDIYRYLPEHYQKAKKKHHSNAEIMAAFTQMRDDLSKKTK